MRCADCPDLLNGTHKRAVCCLRDGKVRAAAEQVSLAFGGRPSASTVETQIAAIVLGPDSPAVARRRAAEAQVINRLRAAQPVPKGRRHIRAAASSGTMLASGGAVHDCLRP